jgi:hypothetical protein
MTIVGKYENCGSRSAFYVIDNKRGFKEFDDKEDAVYAHTLQSKLSDYNMAPYVMSQVGKIRHSNGDLSGWGYITEIAETIGCGGNECSCGECDEDTYYMYESQIVLLSRKMMMEAGVEFIDSHIGNVGFIRRNRKKVLVCIDFGRESVYDEDVPYDDGEDDECDCLICQQRRGFYE